MSASAVRAAAGRGPPQDPQVVLLDPGCFTPFYDLPLAMELRRRGWNVEWITSAFEFEELALPAGLPVQNLFFRRLHGSWLGSKLRGIDPLRRAVKLASYPAGLRRLGRSLADRTPGILHAQWAHVPALDVRAWRALRRAGWRVIYTVHDPRPLVGTTSRVSNGLHRGLLGESDALVVHGPAGRALLLEAGVSTDKVHVMPPGPPLSLGEEPSRERARARLGLPPNAPIVLFFGFVKHYKGIDVLLESLARLRARVPDVRLLIAGEVTERRGAYDRRIARLGLGSQVRWSGSFVPSSELPTYLRAADVVALPYRDGSSSGALLTAQVHGRPVVATRVGDLPELIDSGVTGLLVPPADPSALCGALEELLRSPARAERLAETARRRLADVFSWPAAAARLERIYREAWRGERGCDAGSECGTPTG